MACRPRAQVIELTVLHPRQERRDLGARVDQGRPGPMPGVAHSDHAAGQLDPLTRQFLPGDGPRMKATIDATAARLTDQRGLVYRYLAHDGLAGEEGTFLLCTFWLAQAQALAGEADQAAVTFERAVAAINDVGLLAEEVDVPSGEMIGNFPQAFSHIGLINNETGKAAPTVTRPWATAAMAKMSPRRS
jgi:hypothetical protein